MTCREYDDIDFWNKFTHSFYKLDQFIMVKFCFKLHLNGLAYKKSEKIYSEISLEYQLQTLTTKIVQACKGKRICWGHEG